MPRPRKEKDPLVHLKLLIDKHEKARKGRSPIAVPLADLKHIIGQVERMPEALATARAALALLDSPTSASAPKSKASIKGPTAKVAAKKGSVKRTAAVKTAVKKSHKKSG